MTLDATPLIDAGRLLHSMGLAPATSGNYSQRLPDGTLAMTVSGKHKGQLTADDIMQMRMDGTPLEAKKPSAEAWLHCQLYQRYPAANAVLHAHSKYAVLLGRAVQGDALVLKDYELLKALPGITTHATNAAIPMVDNSQDMHALADAIFPALTDTTCAYIIRNHGYYVWGQDMAEALRLVEAMEYMLECEWEWHKRNV